MTLPALPLTTDEEIELALQRAYKKTAGPVLAQSTILVKSPQSAMQFQLKQLDEEADRLDAAGERLLFTNATLEQTLDEHERSLSGTAQLIQSNGTAIEVAAQEIAIWAVSALVFSQLSAVLNRQGTNPVSAPGHQQLLSTLERGRIPWQVPRSPTDFAELFVSTPAWRERMERWGPGYADRTRATILTGIQEGWGPTYTARQLRNLAEGIPTSAADNLMRTLQLTSYREASAEMELLNSSFIMKKIRIATLNRSTCLACIALHGTELKPGERVDDHYRGRCSEYYVVPGGPDYPMFMQADSEPGERNFVPYQTGEEWFNSLPLERQREQVSFASSPAKWNAFNDGTPLSAFIREHEDSVFGRQLVENSLVGVLGEDLAATYYTHADEGIAQLIKLNSRTKNFDRALPDDYELYEGTLWVTQGKKSVFLAAGDPAYDEALDDISRLLAAHPEAAGKVRTYQKCIDVDSWKYECKQVDLNPRDTLGFFHKAYDQLVLPPGAIPSDTFDHEIGHAVWKNAPQARITWIKLWRDNPGFDRHTNYSKVSAEEGFCEAYSAWIASGRRTDWGSFAEVQQVVEGMRP